MLHSTKARLGRMCLALACAGLLCGACGGDKKGAAPEGKKEEPRKASVEKRDPVDVFLSSLDAFNTSNAAKLRDSFSQDAAWWGPCSLHGPIRGIREIMHSLTTFKGIVPDAKITVRRVLHRENMVVAQTVTVGTKKWSEHGTEETPKPLGFEGIYFVLTDPDGRARETLPYFDQAVMMRQIGALSGEARPIPEPPTGQPEIADKAETDGIAEAAAAALTDLGKGCASLAPLVAPGFTYVDMKSGKKLDLAALPAFLAGERQIDGGLAYTVQQTIGAGSFVAIRWEAAGRFPGKGNVGATDLVLHGAHVFTFEGNKILTVEAYESDFEYLQKTGLIAEAVKGDDEDALGPRGKVPGTSDAQAEDKIATPPAPPESHAAPVQKPAAKTP